MTEVEMYAALQDLGATGEAIAATTTALHFAPQHPVHVAGVVVTRRLAVYTIESEQELANRKTVQAIADAHKSVAYSNDSKVARGDGDLYRATYRALLTAIRTVYGFSPVRAHRVYDVMIDCGEDVAYCVNLVNENPGRHALRAYEH